MNRRRYPTWLKWLIFLILALGIAFRWINLEGKIYWHDEVYTSMRAAGYQRVEIDRALFNNRLIIPSELQTYQRLKPRSHVTDTVESLRKEDPQHPPLYFLMARVWMERFGSSIWVSRSLAALLSLAALPLMYYLSWELFNSRAVALVAMLLVAIAPVDILFAQTARQYSLLTVMVIGSSWSLLRAMRSPRRRSWLLYAASVTIGLYTHPFFGLTLLAQASYVGLLSWVQESVGKLPRFATALAVGTVPFLPWLQVLLTNIDRAQSTTDWSQVAVPISELLKFWLLGFTCMFTDINFPGDNPLMYLLRLPALALILLSLYLVFKRSTERGWLFILMSIAVPFLILATPDLLLGGKRSTVTRYLLECFPAVQLAVAYAVGTGLSKGRTVWKWITAGLLVSAIASCSLSAIAPTWWVKDLSYFNADVIKLANQRSLQHPMILVSDAGDDFTNMGDLVGMSYGFNEQVKLFLLDQPPKLDLLNQFDPRAEVWVFRPSERLSKAIARQQWQLEPISEPARLWKISK